MFLDPVKFVFLDCCVLVVLDSCAVHPTCALLASCAYHQDALATLCHRQEGKALRAVKALRASVARNCVLCVASGCTTQLRPVQPKVASGCTTRYVCCAVHPTDGKKHARR